MIVVHPLHSRNNTHVDVDVGHVLIDWCPGPVCTAIDWGILSFSLSLSPPSVPSRLSLAGTLAALSHLRLLLSYFLYSVLSSSCELHNYKFFLSCFKMAIKNYLLTKEFEIVSNYLINIHYYYFKHLDFL